MNVVEFTKLEHIRTYDDVGLIDTHEQIAKYNVRA